MEPRRNYIAECEICLQSFNLQENKPLRICHNTHVMCLRCFQQRQFSADGDGNKTLCPWCREKVDIDHPNTYEELVIAIEIFHTMTMQQSQSKIKFALDQIIKQEPKDLGQNIAREIVLQKKAIQELQNLLEAQRKKSRSQEIQIQVLVNEIQNLRTKIQKLNESENKFSKTQAAFQDSNKKLEVKQKQLEKQVERWKHQAQKAKEQNKKLQMKSDGFEKQVIKNFMQNQEQITTLKEQVSILKNEKLQFNQSMKQKQKTIKETKKEICELNSQLKELQQNKGIERSKDVEWQFKNKLNIFKVSSQYKSDKISSKIIISKEQQQILIRMFEKMKIVKFQLLFRASDYDFDVRNNKQKFCGVAHTVLLVKTQYGKIIGGYTPLKWKILKRESDTEKDYLSQTFIFSISNNDKLPIESADKYAIVHNDNYGPIFYGGIRVQDKSNTDNKSGALSTYQLDYVHPKYKGRDKKSWQRFTGSSNEWFHTLEWEVYRIFFKK